jgi:hypothetical protein
VRNTLRARSKDAATQRLLLRVFCARSPPPRLPACLLPLVCTHEIMDVSINTRCSKSDVFCLARVLFQGFVSKGSQGLLFIGRNACEMYKLMLMMLLSTAYIEETK